MTWLWSALFVASIILGNFAWYKNGKARGRIWAYDKNERWLGAMRAWVDAGRPLSDADVLRLWGREWFPEVADEEIAKEWEKHVAQRGAVPHG